MILYFKINNMEREKTKIKDLVECINKVYAEKDVRKIMFVDFGWYCNVYTEAMDSHYKKTAFKSMNYKECRIWLEWYLEAL